MVHHAVPELHKVHIYKRPGKASVTRTAPKARMHEKRRWMYLEFSNGIWDHNLKKQLCLRMGRRCDRIFRITIEFEIDALIIESTIGCGM
jgi:hypothetical protein